MTDGEALLDAEIVFQQMNQLIASGRTGDSLIYYIGNLACEVGANYPFDKVRAAAWRGARTGRLLLTQQRLGRCRFAYRATVA